MFEKHGKRWKNTKRKVERYFPFQNDMITAAILMRLNLFEGIGIGDARVLSEKRGYMAKIPNYLEKTTKIDLR